MIYLISQILLCLALAGLLGGAIGWLLQRSRGVARFDAARHALAERSRQLERARTDVSMLSDDFDDLRERSRVEIDALRQENRQLPALAQNLEKSQLLVRQMIQRHDSQTRELEATNATLRDQIAQLQEQVVTRERALAEAAKAAKGIAAGRPDGGVGHGAGGMADAAPASDGASAAPPAPGEPANEDARSSAAGEAGSDADAAPRRGDPTSVASAGGVDARPPPAVGGDEPRAADRTAAPPPSERIGSASRRGWASLPLAGGDAPDELMDEVMELDDAFAAELRGDVDAGAPDDARDDARDDERDDARDDADVEAAAGTDGAESRNDDANVDDTDAHGLSETSLDAVALADGSDAEGAAPWDEDEEGNATLAIEVFSMEDVHEVEEPDASPGDASTATDRPAVTLFRPVDRQDDLQRISGIGAVTEKALNELGITSYPQLAKLERPEIEKLAEALEIGPERIERDDWVGNARRQLEDVLEEL